MNFLLKGTLAITRTEMNFPDDGNVACRNKLH